MQPLWKCLLLALVGALVPAVPADAGSGGCGQVRRVVEQNDAVEVYWGPRNADDRRSLCARYRSRRPMVLSRTSLDSGPESWRLVGRFVFLTEQQHDRGTGDQYAWASLADVRRRRWRHQWEFYALAPVAPIAFEVVRLRRSGNVAFSVSGVDSDVDQRSGAQAEIHRALGPFQDLVAAGPDVDAASLRFSKERMHWDQGGRAWSAFFA